MNKFNVYEATEDIPYEELTEVLNTAYGELLEKNLNYAAARQNVEKTKERIKDGICIIVEKDKKIVGTLTYHVYEKKEKSKWYIDGKYIVVTQFAVLPEYRKDKVVFFLARRLMKDIAKDKEIACVIADTSVEANHLVKDYVNSGMQIVDYISWVGTNYYSYVFRKRINGVEFEDSYCEKKLKTAKWKCRLQYKKNGSKTILGKIIMQIKGK